MPLLLQSLVRQDKPFLAEIESHTSWRAMQRQRHDMALQVVDVLSGYLEDLCKGL